MIHFEDYDGGNGQPLLKYALFMGATYYPNGGAKDLRATANTVDELEPLVAAMILDWGGTAEEVFKLDSDYVWWQIAESATLRIIKEG